MKYDEKELDAELDNFIYEIKFLLDIKENLFSYIKTKKINMSDLARKIGVSRQCMHQWKNGEYIPMNRISDILYYLNENETFDRLNKAIKILEFTYKNKTNMQLMTNSIRYNTELLSNRYSIIQIKNTIEVVKYFKENANMNDKKVIITLYHKFIESNSSDSMNDVYKIYSDYLKAKRYKFSNFTLNYLSDKIAQIL